MGIIPNIIVTRADEPIDETVKQKIALFCNVKPDCVIENLTLPVLYQAPLMLEQNNFSDIVCRELNIDLPRGDLGEWKEMLNRIAGRDKKVKIALVGNMSNCTMPIYRLPEALHHAGYENQAVVDIDWIEAEDVTPQTAESIFADCDGILVPGGFGDRGIEGKITAAKYAQRT